MLSVWIQRRLLPFGNPDEHGGRNRLPRTSDGIFDAMKLDEVISSVGSVNDRRGFGSSSLEQGNHAVFQIT